MNNLFCYTLISLLTFSICCTDNIKKPDNTAQFESKSLGLSVAETELTVKINFAQKVENKDTIVLTLSSKTVEYGTHFTTDPAAVEGKLKLPYPAESTSVSFTVKKVVDENSPQYPRDGDEVQFLMATPSSPLVLGTTKLLTLSFSEITADKVTANPDVGGPTQSNIVFFDLSANRQKVVPRDTWDLSFYTRDGNFRVFLNATVAMMARQLEKSDLSQVTAEDTVGLGKDLALDVQSITQASDEWQQNAKNWVDDPAGDITKTAMAEVSAIANDNKVYIINRGKNATGGERGWKKIRILRNGAEGYEVRYADIGTTVAYQTIRVEPDEAYLFDYINFDTPSTVSVEPKKEQWDIAFTVYTMLTRFGPPSAPLVPYLFSDVVIQNRHRVTTAQVLTSVVTYDGFGETDIQNVVFSSEMNAIGSSWRNGGGPGAAPSLRTDRFYVIKDIQGNVYKLTFTALTQNGERGRPQIKFDLVQKKTE